MKLSLFVDESGAFDGHDPSVVAGLLVDRGLDEVAGAPIRAELERIWGPGPWPPHATELRFPVAPVLYRAWRPRPGQAAMAEGRAIVPFRAELGALAAALESSRFGPRLDAIRDGAFPTRDDIEEADATLRRHPALGAMRALLEKREELTRDLLARLGRRSGGVTLVAALADDRPPGGAPSAGALREDTWLRALSVVFERVARLEGRAEVDLLVLTRNVEVGGLGPVPMQARWLDTLAEEATRRAGADLRFRPAGTVFRYQEDAKQGALVHPMLALADWVANRLRHLVRQRPGDWDTLAARLVAMRVVPGPGALERTPRGRALGPLPTVAAAGAPEERIRAAFGGETVDVGETGWEWDQARRWVAAAGRWA